MPDQGLKARSLPRVDEKIVDPLRARVKTRDFARMRDTSPGQVTQPSR